MISTAHNTVEKMITSAQMDFDAASDLLSQAKSFKNIRPYIFASFEEADFYYKNEPIRLLRSAMKKAVEDGNEVLEVDCAQQLYCLLSSKLTSEGKMSIIEKCLLPLIDLLSDLAKGNLHYYIGKFYDVLGQKKLSVNHYHSAIELDNERILSDEEVFETNTDFIFFWLQKFLGDSEKRTKAERFEIRLNKLTTGTLSRPQVCLQLAKLHKKKNTGNEERYFRECIRLGVCEVAQSREFLKPDFEDEYISWYNAIVSEDPVKAKKLCFDTLWQSGYTIQDFENSHKIYCSSLLEQGLSEDACSEYVICANNDLSWATDFLIEHIKENPIQNAITDELIDKWYHAPWEREEIHTALGQLFISGKGEQYFKTWKYYYCLCLFKLEEGALMASLAFFQDFAAFHEKDADFMRNLGKKINDAVECGYQKILIEEFTERRPRISLQEKIAPFLGFDSKIANYESCCMNQKIRKLLSTEVDKNDVGFLRNFIRRGTFPADLSIFYDDQRSLVSRHLLLRMMSKVALQACYNVTENERESIFNQGNNLALASQRELFSSMTEANFLALMVWIVEHLYKTPLTAEAESCLFLLSLSISPKQSKLPFLILANFFAKDPVQHNGLSLLLKFLLADDAKLNEWEQMKKTDDLIKGVCEYLLPEVDE